jgi:hypothetical protein
MRIDKRRDGSRNHALLNPEWVPSFLLYLTNLDAVFFFYFFFSRNNNHNVVRGIHLLLSLSHPHSFVKCIIADVSKFASLKAPATVLRYCSNRKVDRRRRRRSPLRSSNSRSRVSRPTFSAASFNCTEERELHETRSAEKTSRCSKRNTRSTQTDRNRVQQKIDPPAMR